MNKLIAVVAVASLASAVFADGAPITADPAAKGKREFKQLTPEEKAERKARRREAFLRHTGGFVRDTRNQKGRVVFVNAQTRAKSAWLNDVATWVDESVKVVTRVEDGKFDFANIEKHGDFTVFVIDDANQPSILIAPEQHWSMMNVAAFYSEKEPFFEARTKKQLIRAFSMLCGASMSNYPNPLYFPVEKPTDFDKIVDWRMPVDVINRCEQYLASSGVQPYRQTYYKTAVEEGWAAAPTNDIQKAIWDEVHTLPTDPIKIKYDPKRDK